jgi:[ribosomal protein S5]-alanine N-acetyltransferase
MDDLQVVHQFWTNDHIRRYLFDNQFISLDVARAFIERSLADFSACGYGIWLVHLVENDQPIGFAGFLGSTAEEPSLVYGIHPDYIGKGYATEAAGVVLNYGLVELGLSKVRADVDEPNQVSVRVLEKLGMKQIGRKIRESHSLLYYEITPGS